MNLTMKDAQMKVSKVDEETGEDVLGAEFSVFDKQGNLVDQWITDGSQCQGIRPALFLA